MVYAPFGKSPGKKVWSSIQAYYAELQHFLEEHTGLPMWQRYRLWFSRPGHIGRKAYTMKRIKINLLTGQLLRREGKPRPLTPVLKFPKRKKSPKRRMPKRRR